MMANEDQRERGHYLQTMFANIYAELVAINVEPNLSGRTFTMSIQHKYHIKTSF